eukprot:1232750-Rhodomonas_salina.4
MTLGRALAMAGGDREAEAGERECRSAHPPVRNGHQVRSPGPTPRAPRPKPKTETKVRKQARDSARLNAPQRIAGVSLRQCVVVLGHVRVRCLRLLVLVLLRGTT